jgi:hypothetical protein
MHEVFRQKRRRQRRRLLVAVLRQAKRLTNHQRSLAADIRTLGISRRDGGPRKSGMTLMIILGRVMDRRRRNLFQSEAARTIDPLMIKGDIAAQ